MLNHITMFQPSAIDNAFSTIQIIHKLINHMNKVIDEVNSIDSKANQYTDEKIAEVREEITQLNDRLQTQLTTLERQLKTYSDNNLNTAEEYTDVAVEQFKLNYVIPQLTQIRETITLIENRLDSKIDLVDVTLKNLIQETKAELLELIKKGGAVYSGVTGELTNADNAIKQLVDKVQHKNGVEWNDILSIMASQDIGKNTSVLDMANFTQYGKTDKFILSVDNLLSLSWSSSLYISPISGTDTQANFVYLFGSIIGNVKSIIINNDVIPTYITDNSGSTFKIPIYRKNTDNTYTLGYVNKSGQLKNYKRINIIKLFTDFGEITAVMRIENDDLEFELPTYDTIIASCNNNKKWNTWDSLTYYTTKFLSEHLATENYNIQISNEYEILYNNSPTLKNFYDNRT